MSTQNVLWLIQNLSPTFKFLLSRHTMSTLKNKALALQMAEVKTTKWCSHFTCVKITQKKAAGILSHGYTLNSLQTSDPLISESHLPQPSPAGTSTRTDLQFLYVVFSRSLFQVASPDTDSWIKSQNCNFSTVSEYF